MLLSFSLENWMSFRDKTSFSMIASRERQHGEHISRIPKYELRVLPVAAIYGGNASGKSNFFKALRFAQKLVVRGTQPDGTIAVEPFRLEKAKRKEASSFTFVIFVDGAVYEFSFSVRHKAVLEEKLIHITNSREKILYHRYDGKPHFDASLAGENLLQFAFQGTRENQLFLTNSVSQNVDTFRPIYDWFRNSLTLVGPDSRFLPFERFFDQGTALYTEMNELLSQLDTGIVHLGTEELPLDQSALPETIKNKLREETEEGDTVRITNGHQNLVITHKDGDLSLKKLATFHREANGEEIKFAIEQESDGTQRLLDLLPAFLELSDSNASRVYIVDELDRSLHTVLTRTLLERYLSGCSATHLSQLLFTTHDLLLMDQELLRRDEMWVTERDGSGTSDLFSFIEYKKIRYDKDIRKSYLQGRLGGIPHIAQSVAAPPLSKKSSEEKAQ